MQNSRNRLDCSSDVTMADNMKTYRQALRDLPASNDGKDASLVQMGLWKMSNGQKPA